MMATLWLWACRILMWEEHRAEFSNTFCYSDCFYIAFNHVLMKTTCNINENRQDWCLVKEIIFGAYPLYHFQGECWVFYSRTSIRNNNMSSEYHWVFVIYFIKTLYLRILIIFPLSGFLKVLFVWVQSTFQNEVTRYPVLLILYKVKLFFGVINHRVFPSGLFHPHCIVCLGWFY